MLVGRVDCPEIKPHGAEELDVQIETIVIVVQIYLARIRGEPPADELILNIEPGVWRPELAS
jgi:hypothetical protein